MLWFAHNLILTLKCIIIAFVSHSLYYVHCLPFASIFSTFPLNKLIRKAQYRSIASVALMGTGNSTEGLKGDCIPLRSILHGIFLYRDLLSEIFHLSFYMPFLANHCNLKIPWRLGAAFCRSLLAKSEKSLYS